MKDREIQRQKILRLIFKNNYLFPISCEEKKQPLLFVSLIVGNRLVTISSLNMTT